MKRDERERRRSERVSDRQRDVQESPERRRRRTSDTAYSREYKKKKRRRSRVTSIFLILLLVLLTLATTVFLVQSGKIDISKIDIPIPDFGGTRGVIREAEQMAEKYDYDGAITLLQQHEKFASNTKLQEKAASFESLKAVMDGEISTSLENAEKIAATYDYQGAADALKGDKYYKYSSALQEKAVEYEEAEKHKDDLDPAVVEEADRLAAMYDYDAAIEKLKGLPAYQVNATLQQKVTEYETSKAACVPINPENVTHVFYHSLVVDPAKGFVPGSAGYDGWQQWMTTIYEFDKITQSMYDRGYVLVNLSDLYTSTKAEDGTVTIKSNPVYLPEGKKAFVMSLDDLSYYHTYDDHGVASKLVLDENGKPTCEYIEEDGSVSYGAYDVVPRLNAFIEEHPDATYRNAKATIALTGYDGILGYRTDGAYSEEHNTNTDIYYADQLQLEWLAEHPDFDYEKECAQAKKVAEALKADGWEFASHTWGHKEVGDASYESLVQDTERWMQYVSPLIGGTNTIIFAHGQDLSPTGVYDSANEKYNYLKSQGFDVYCNVDSAVYSTTVTDQYFHQGRRNLDGYRIWQDYTSGNPMAADLFDAAEVLDPERPQPVPDL